MLDTTRIKKGMTVYTTANEKIGTVEYVQYGDEDLNSPGVETSTVSENKNDSPDFIIDLARALVDDNNDMPEELRAHLERYGYLRLNTGNLFESDYYVPFNLITSITGENVHIRATKDDLVSA